MRTAAINGQLAIVSGVRKRYQQFQGLFYVLLTTFSRLHVLNSMYFALATIGFYDTTVILVL